MTPLVRKLVLTLHVLCSLGWFGAVLAFMSLALVGLSSRELAHVRAAYVAADVMGWSIIVPACVATLVTGVIQALGTQWGLFRHYWVVIKLALTCAGTLLLMVHMRPIDATAGIAANMTEIDGDLKSIGVQLVMDSGAALVLLIVATVLSVFKPRGITRYGLRHVGDEN